MLTKTATTTSATAAAIDLSKLNVSVLIDQSKSMDTKDTPSGKSRWNYSKEVVSSLVAKFGKFSPNGINLGFFNRKVSIEKGVKPDNFDAAWDKHSPDGGTVFGPALKAMLDIYPPSALTETQHFLLVLTDGEPEDQKAAMDAISDYTQNMQADEQVGIMIARVGTDAGAKAYLDILDNGLTVANGCTKDAKFDIVHVEEVTNLDGEDPQDIANAAFND